jgi:hypoxanthine phosphoribosyltransferase
MDGNETNFVEKVLIDEETLMSRVRELGREITEDYANEKEELVLVGILKGSVMFMADLAKSLKLPVSFDFMSVSSYGSGMASSGNVRILKDLDHDISGKNVLIVEDIVDSGNTLSYIKESLLKRGAHSVKIVTLLNKPDRREKEVVVDYEGFEIPNVFVIGYGLDFAERYRNLPYIAILKVGVYS